MTLDDAAERRIREIESFAEHAYRNSGGDMKEAIRSALRTAWREGAESATEAAAKKCEARVESLRRVLREHAIHEFPDEQMMQCGECGNVWRKGFPEDHGLSVPDEQLCAAAIRGKD